MNSKRSKARTSDEWLAARKHTGLSVSGKPYTYPDLPTRVNSSMRVRVTCADHGTWECYAAAHLTHGCPGCGILRMAEGKRGEPAPRKFSLDKVLERARSIHTDIDYAEVTYFSGNKDVWNLRCLRHNLEYTVGVFGHLYDKTRGCPSCRSDRIRVTAKKMSADRDWQWQDQLDRLGYRVISYSGSHNRCVLSCKEHGKFELAKAYYLSQGWSACPVCRKGSSQPEVALVTALRRLGHRVELHRRDLLSDRELDLYLPKYKVGIEVNGVFYHDTRVKERMYHADKQRRLLDLGITLFSFTDMEIHNSLDLVVSMIQAKCGLVKYGFGARNTVVREITPPIARGFLGVNHMQGFCGATHHLGAFFVNRKTGSERLVSVASFSKPRFTVSEDASWELIRFATLRDTAISGMLSRLLTVFRRSHTGGIFSYANLRYGNGNAYRAVGFEELGRSRPGYFWIDKNGNQLSRHQTRKSDLADFLEDYDDLESENDNMVRHGYYKLWDCGNLRFLLR